MIKLKPNVEPEYVSILGGQFTHAVVSENGVVALFQNEQLAGLFMNLFTTEGEAPIFVLREIEN